MKIVALRNFVGGGRRGGGVRKERHNGGDFLCARLLHARDGQKEFHNTVVDVLILEGLYDEHAVPSHNVQHLDVDFAILEFGCDMPSEGHIEVGGDFLAERFGVEGEDFEIGELTDVGREKDFVYVGFELRC